MPHASAISLTVVRTPVAANSAAAAPRISALRTPSFGTASTPSWAPVDDSTEATVLALSADTARQPAGNCGGNCRGSPRRLWFPWWARCPFVGPPVRRTGPAGLVRRLSVLDACPRGVPRGAVRRAGRPSRRRRRPRREAVGPRGGRYARPAAGPPEEGSPARSCPGSGEVLGSPSRGGGEEW